MVSMSASPLRGQLSAAWALVRQGMSHCCFRKAVKLGGSSPGHEAAFAAFLCCLCKIGVLRVDDQIAIVFKVFNR